jgi:hypothetical protein
LPGKKLRIFLNYFVGPILFVVLSFSIYRQVQQQSDWQQKWKVIAQSLTGPNRWLLYLTIGLMLVNWGLEARKWQLLLRHVQRLSYLKSFVSVLSGVAFTMITPNRMGEFIGRVFYVEEGKRIQAATLTFVGSISQLIVTLATGITGVIVLHSRLVSFTHSPGLSLYWVNGLMFGTAAMLALLLLFYFKLSWLIRLAEKIPLLQKYQFFITQLDHFTTKELLAILSLSFLRFCIFTAQYLLLFSLFDVEIPLWQACCGVSVMFLILAVIPMPGIAELGIRGKAGISLFTLFSANQIGILAAMGSIWLINIIFPAVLGSLLMLNVKIFGKNNVKNAG